jgi:hypothetical protein
MRQDGNDYFLDDEEFRNDVGREVWETAPVGARVFVDPPEGGRVTFVVERDEDGWGTHQ